ncbi:MAG TPA: EscU/YscU/HrcU family type III secretion system export apparatus switch protein [Solirubrobacteraceae bacterium]|jgi:flagellar biosynthesis protein
MPERPERAIALKYSGSGAPQVAASGQGLVAERIRALAEEAGVPIRRDPALAAALSTLDLGKEIPEELYLAVAEVLAWAYQLSPPPA